MNQLQSFAQLKDSARIKLSGKYGNSVMITLMNQLLIFATTFSVTILFSVFSAIRFTLTQSEDMGTGLTIALYLVLTLCSIFAGVFQTGIALYFLNLACDRTAMVSNLFYGFQYLLKPSLLISTVMVLLNTLCMLPYDVSNYLASVENSTVSVPIVAACFVIGMIIYIPLSLGLSQSYYLLLDFPRRSAKELMSLSLRIMKGHKRRLFLLELSFIPLLLLGILSFGIGTIWITPYMNMTMAFFFLDLMQNSNTTH